MSIYDKRSCYLFPKSLGDCVEPVTRPILKTQGLAGSKVLTEWESIVGAQLSKHTLPEKLTFPKGKKTGGTLVISTENGFATELQHMQPLILERLAGYFGYQAINRITISHTWVPAVAAPKQTPAVSKPTLPLDCASLTDGIEDVELKNALLSLARTLSGQ